MSSRRICNRARVLKVLVVGTQRRSRDVGIFCVAVDACGSNPDRGDSNTSFGSRGASKKFWKKTLLHTSIAQICENMTPSSANDLCMKTPSKLWLLKVARWSFVQHKLVSKICSLITPGFFNGGALCYVGMLIKCLILKMVSLPEWTRHWCANKHSNTFAHNVCCSLKSLNSVTGRRGKSSPI